jgi:LPS sulfotransferase NodH
MARFKSFVMFAEMRTGSNFLQMNLNAIPGVLCYGELFNAYFMATENQTSMYGFDMAAREADPMALVSLLQSNTDDLMGFRVFHDHDPRVIRAVLEDHSCAKIILTRNPMESYVSHKIALATNLWKMGNPKDHMSGQAQFDAIEFEDHLTTLQEFQMHLMRQLQVTGQTAFYIDYDDVLNIDVLNGLAAFLGVKGRLAAIDDKLKKQNPQEIADKVINPADLEKALARLDRFNLARTPNFEPRRGPAVPGFIAAGGLLYMPVKGGPEEAVHRWLQGLGPLISDFTQKTLKQWKRGTPTHRSFTVLRDPLARADAAFRARILTGARADVRLALAKAHGVTLPDPGTDFASDDDYRAALLGFLRYVKMNISGQTGQKVDAHWASQAAVLQGFAQFQGPDLVLREGRMAPGLAYLAAEIGQEGPRPESPPIPNPIYDTPELQAAAREAYVRDYLAFGF